MTQIPPISAEQVEAAARAIALAEGKNPDAMSHNSFAWWRHYVPHARASLATVGYMLDTLKAIGSWSDGGENAHMLASVAREATASAAALNAAASIPASRGADTEGYYPQVIHYDGEGDGYHEFVNADVMTITDVVEARNVEAIRSIEGGRPIIGFRIYDAPQPVQEQEPVAWRRELRGEWQSDVTQWAETAEAWRSAGFTVTPLYASPPEQELRAKVERLETERDEAQSIAQTLLAAAEANLVLMQDTAATVLSMKNRAEAAEAKVERLTEALRRVEAWEFPTTGKFWDNADGSLGERPMSYGACYGSDGERDYMRSVARAALGDTP